MILKGQLKNWGRGQINKVFLGVNWNVCELLDRQRPSAPIRDWLWSQIRCGAQSYCSKIKGSSQVTTWPLNSIQKCSFSVTQEHLYSPGVDQVLTKKRWETDGHAFTEQNWQPHSEYKAGFSNYLNFGGKGCDQEWESPPTYKSHSLCPNLLSAQMLSHSPWVMALLRDAPFPTSHQENGPERVGFQWFHKDIT